MAAFWGLPGPLWSVRSHLCCFAAADPQRTGHPRAQQADAHHWRRAQACCNVRRQHPVEILALVLLEPRKIPEAAWALSGVQDQMRTLS